MLRITELHADGGLVLKLEGQVSGAWVRELDACWRLAEETLVRQRISVDLSDVWLVDGEGQEQLARMHRAGVRFRARGCEMRELIREIAESR
jgi:hypothetical protein